MMRRRKHSLTLKLVAGALLFAVCVGSFPGGAIRTYSKETSIEGEAAKVSRELEKLDKDFNADAILQLNGPLSAALSDFLKKNAAVKESFTNFNAHAIKIKVSFISELIKFPEVSFVTLDRKVKKMGHASLTTGANAARALGGRTPYTGSGVVVAVLDSGVEVAHKSLMADSKRSSVSFSKDFISDLATVDSYGHGTHVATIAAGNAHIAGGAYTGVAPGADIINVRVLDNKGEGLTSDALNSINWVIQNKDTYKIRVMNLSFGTVAVESYHQDPLCKAVEKAWKAGIAVVAAAGNSGKDSQGRKVYGPSTRPASRLSPSRSVPRTPMAPTTAPTTWWPATARAGRRAPTRPTSSASRSTTT